MALVICQGRDACALQAWNADPDFFKEWLSLVFC
jgi:hypothetical protein